MLGPVCGVLGRGEVWRGRARTVAQGCTGSGWRARGTGQPSETPGPSIVCFVAYIKYKEDWSVLIYLYCSKACPRFFFLTHKKWYISAKVKGSYEPFILYIQYEATVLVMENCSVCMAFFIQINMLSSKILTFEESQVYRIL